MNTSTIETAKESRTLTPIRVKNDKNVKTTESKIEYSKGHNNVVNIKSSEIHHEEKIQKEKNNKINDGNKKDKSISKKDSSSVKEKEKNKKEDKKEIVKKEEKKEELMIEEKKVKIDKNEEKRLKKEAKRLKKEEKIDKDEEKSSKKEDKKEEKSSKKEEKIDKKEEKNSKKEKKDLQTNDKSEYKKEDQENKSKKDKSEDNKLKKENDKIEEKNEIIKADKYSKRGSLDKEIVDIKKKNSIISVNSKRESNSKPPIIKKNSIIENDKNKIIKDLIKITVIEDKIEIEKNEEKTITDKSKLTLLENYPNNTQNVEVKSKVEVDLIVKKDDNVTINQIIIDKINQEDTVKLEEIKESKIDIPFKKEENQEPIKENIEGKSEKDIIQPIILENKIELIAEIIIPTIIEIKIETDKAKTTGKFNTLFVVFEEKKNNIKLKLNIFAEADLSHNLNRALFLMSLKK